MFLHDYHLACEMITLFYIFRNSGFCQVYAVIRAASHYTILSLRRPTMAPHDAVADRTSCSVRPSAILSAAILTIGVSQAVVTF